MQTIMQNFTKENEDQLDSIVCNTIKYNHINFDVLDIETITTSLELMSSDIKSGDEKKFINAILPTISEKLFSSDDKEIEYEIKSRCLSRIATLILNANKSEVLLYIKPFVDNFKPSKNASDLCKSFVTAQDMMSCYENFWIVWNALYDKISELHNTSNSYHFDDNIKHYLFAQYHWNKNVKEWSGLKDRERIFYKRIVQTMGCRPSVFYSIIKVLNDIGSNFADDGVIWISDIVQKNDMLGEKLEGDTIYYLEIFIKRFQLKNRHKIKRSPQLRKCVITILDFLIESGSAKGYLLRESIL
jgi:hypothetical protein